MSPPRDDVGAIAQVWAGVDAPPGGEAIVDEELE